MKIYAMLRVRNEARWIAEVLASIAPITSDVIVFDDHSTDETREIAAASGAAVIHSPFDDRTDEVRDKNFMLDVVRDFGAEYVLAIDGDEILEARAAERLLPRLRPVNSVYNFRIKYIWNDRDHYRVDGVYANFHRASIFSLIAQPASIKFAAPFNKHGFHCGNVPFGLKGHGCGVPADILHLGYQDSEDRIRKYHWYNQKDPNNHFEDCYRHMVIGDLFPADSKFLHGGPLKLFTLGPGKWPKPQIAAEPIVAL